MRRWCLGSKVGYGLSGYGAVSGFGALVRSFVVLHNFDVNC
jgi:hypothetical protein